MKTSIKLGFRLIQSKSFSNFGKKRNSPFELIRSQVGPDFSDKKNKAKNDSLSAIRAHFRLTNSRLLTLFEQSPKKHEREIFNRFLKLGSRNPGLNLRVRQTKNAYGIEMAYLRI